MPLMKNLKNPETGESLQNPQDEDEATHVEKVNEQNNKAKENEKENNETPEEETQAPKGKEGNSNINKENEDMTKAETSNERTTKERTTNNPPKKGRNAFNRRITLEFNQIFSGETYPKYILLTAQSNIKTIELEDYLMRIHPSSEMSFKKCRNEHQWIIHTTSKSQAERYLKIRKITV